MKMKEKIHLLQEREREREREQEAFDDESGLNEMVLRQLMAVGSCPCCKCPL